MRIEFQGDTMAVYADKLFAGQSVCDLVNQILESLQAGKISICSIDFGKTNLIDSSGIGFLVSLAKDFRNNNARLILKNIEGDIFQLFEKTGLDRIFTIDKKGELRNADIDLFENNGLDVRLDIKKEFKGNIGIFIMSGVLNHPFGSSYFKQQFLLFLTKYKNILLDFKELEFFDSLSISAILNMNNLLKGTGGCMKICSPNYIIRDLLTTVSIDLIIPVFDRREDALNDWGNNNE